MCSDLTQLKKLKSKGHLTVRVVKIYKSGKENEVTAFAFES